MSSIPLVPTAVLLSVRQEPARQIPVGPLMLSLLAPQMHVALLIAAAVASAFVLLLAIVTSIPRIRELPAQLVLLLWALASLKVHAPPVPVRARMRLLLGRRPMVVVMLLLEVGELKIPLVLGRLRRVVDLSVVIVLLLLMVPSANRNRFVVTVRLLSAPLSPRLLVMLQLRPEPQAPAKLLLEMTMGMVLLIMRRLRLLLCIAIARAVARALPPRLVVSVLLLAMLNIQAFGWANATLLKLKAVPPLSVGPDVAVELPHAMLSVLFRASATANEKSLLLV